jgi:hypothetical protein
MGDQGGGGLGTDLQGIASRWAGVPPADKFPGASVASTSDAITTDGWGGAMPVSNNIEDVRHGMTIGQYLDTMDLVEWVRQQLYSDTPTAEQQRYLNAHFPTDIPTTPLDDPNRPQFVTQGSPESGYWQQNASGTWTHNPPNTSSSDPTPGPVGFLAGPPRELTSGRSATENQPPVE